jgi:hypothetical protein
MTEQTSATGGTGVGTITRDAKIGQLTNAVVTAAGLAVVEWLGSLDFSSAPRVIATLAPPVVGLAVGWITTRALPRFKVHRSR